MARDATQRPTAAALGGRCEEGLRRAARRSRRKSEKVGESRRKSEKVGEKRSPEDRGAVPRERRLGVAVMSTSTGKPFNPSNSLQRDAEHGDAERRGGEDPTVRSPYAPKRVRGGFIAPVRADDQVPAPPRFLLDTKGSGRGLTDFSDTSLRFGDEAFDEGEWPADERDHRGSG